MKLSRRALLKATLGATQAAMLSQLRPSYSWANAQNQPTKLLTIFMGGGWMSPWSFVSLNDAQIAQLIPQKRIVKGEPVFFGASDMVNLDGSSGMGSAAPLRLPRLWNQTELSAGRPDPKTGGATSPNGWSWVQHRLWENAMVVHGVDQRTVAHAGGQISALTGIAGSDFKSPSLQAWAAEGLYARFPDRPIPSVWIGGPIPEAVSLRPLAGPVAIFQDSDLQLMYSDASPRAWDKLRARDIKSTLEPRSFDNAVLKENFVLNPIEDRVARRARALGAKVNQPSRDVLQQLHDGFVGVSRVLAKDITAKVEATKGVEHTPRPFWAPSTGSHFAVSEPSFKSDIGTTWDDQLTLALRLLKADVCSCVSVQALAPGNQSWDNGHSEGHLVQFVQVRAVLEVLGRLLGEMKATPGSTAGKSLLDETLVVVLSDFGRTWPNGDVSSGHWADNSVIFAGGGLQYNRMLGGYAISDPNAMGYPGLPLPIREASGMVNRPPRSADVVTTALATLGLTDVRISGGNGEIQGVRAGA